MKRLLFTIALLNIFAALGQNKADSLRKAIGAGGNDSLRASAMINLAGIHNNNGQHDSGVFYGKQALEIGRRIKNKAIESTSYATIGVCYHFAGKYKNALDNYLLSLKMEEAMDRKKKVAKILNNIGVLYADQRFFDLAEKSYLKSYKSYAELKDTVGIIQAGNNLGALYGNKSQIEKDSIMADQLVKKAVEFNTQTFEYAKKIKDRTNITNSLANLGQNYL